jgi:ribosomal protein S18 acetylase RimI-like enzyme
LSVPEYALRAAVRADRGVLFDLHRSTMKEYIEPIWGWDEDLQQRIFEERLGLEDVRMVLVEGHVSGMVKVTRRPDEIFLARIEIAPTQQRRGIGSAIIREVLLDGLRERLPVTLEVLHGNPARALYERLGFLIVDENEERCFMRAELS